MPEGLRDACTLAVSRPHRRPLGTDDSLQLHDTGFQFVVDDNVVIPRYLLDLAMRYSQPAHQFDLCQMGAAAAAEPFFQYDRRRRQDENPDRVRLQAPDLLSTLDVNNENEIPPSIKMSSSVDCTGAIKMLSLIHI